MITMLQSLTNKLAKLSVDFLYWRRIVYIVERVAATLIQSYQAEGSVLLIKEEE